MRSFSLPLPTLFAGFVAVLVGYASSAAIIWQAAAAAGATPGQIAGWMTALGLAMGISTLALSAWRKVPVLTAWSTPGAALLVSGLQGVTLAEAVGIFIFANALIVICGATGLFARLMQIIPHSLAAAMLAGILLRFGLQAFAGLQDHLPLCGGMLAAWLLCKALWPRFAVVAALVIGALIAAASGRYAMAVLFAVAFMESSFFPVPPDVMIIPMVLAARDRAWRIAGMATAASVIGGYFGYAIGFYGYDLIARPILEFYGYLHQFDVFKGYYHEWGAWIVFGAGLTPFPYKVVTIASGAVDLNLWVFGIASVLSRGMRFFLVAWLLKKYGEPIRVFIEKNLGILTVVFLFLLLGGFALIKYL